MEAARFYVKGLVELLMFEYASVGPYAASKGTIAIHVRRIILRFLVMLVLLWITLIEITLVLAKSSHQPTCGWVEEN